MSNGQRIQFAPGCRNAPGDTVADRYDAKLEFPNVRVWKDRTANGAGQCRGVARRRLPQRSRWRCTGFQQRTTTKIGLSSPKARGLRRISMRTMKGTVPEKPRLNRFWRLRTLRVHSHATLKSTIWPR